MDPDRLYRDVCPDGSPAMSHPSSGVLGTAYGNWLGVTYMRELQQAGRPLTYGIVDFQVYTGSTSWWPGSIFSLHAIDPLVAGALSLSEFTPGWRRERADILNADTDEVFEIKPRRARDRGEGPDQLQRYIDTLNLLAPETPPNLGPVRPRHWHGGTWDPSRYPKFVTGPQGSRCLIHAWQDPLVQGLLVYDITCCPRPQDNEPRESLRPTRVVEVVRELELQGMRTGFDQMREAVFEVAEAGARYAILVSERFFELFVKGVWDRDQDRLRDLYGPAPGPAFRKFMLDTLALESIIGGPLGNLVIATSGYVSKDMAATLLKVGATEAVTGVVVVVAMLALPTLVAAAATLAEAAWARAISAYIAATATGTTVALNALPRAATVLPRAGPPLLNGAETLLQIGRTVGPRLIGSTTGPGPLTAGLGCLGAFLYAQFPAEAGAAGAVPPDPSAVVPAAELSLVAPVEMLQPVGGGTIGAGSFVRCGAEKYFVPAMIRAD